MKKILIHANEVIRYEENGGTWETSYRCCIMKKVILQDDTARGGFDFSGLC